MGLIIMKKTTWFCAIYLGLLAATLILFAFLRFPGAFLIAYSAPVHFLCLTGLVIALLREKNTVRPPVFPVITGILMLLALLFSAWMWYALTRYFAYG